MSGDSAKRHLYNQKMKLITIHLPINIVEFVDKLKQRKYITNRNEYLRNCIIKNIFETSKSFGIQLTLEENPYLKSGKTGAVKRPVRERKRGKFEMVKT
jgi:hypothetical protein